MSRPGPDGATPSVALVKRLRESLLDAATPQRVVFHHVPKCGGTSVGLALRKRYLLSQATIHPEHSFRAFQEFTGRTDRDQMLVDVQDLRQQMLLYHLFDDVRCISLHVPFSAAAYRVFQRKYKFVTMLREPVERFVSHYFWSYGRPHAHGAITEEFPAFLETDRARRMGSSYVEFFAGLPKETDLRSDSAISEAIANLGRFDVVGRLDDIKTFEADLKRALKITLRIGHVNKMRQPKTVKQDLVTPELLERVEELCKPDIAVWEAVNG